MNCREIHRIYKEYLQNKFSALKRIQLEEHIRDCPDCLFFSEIERKIFLTEHNDRLKREDLNL